MNKNIKTEPLWCFRRWSRKPWAVFAGLGRFKIGVLSVAMSIILLTTQFAGAQTVEVDSLSNSRTLQIDEVQVVTTTALAMVVSSPQIRVKDVEHLGSAEAMLRLRPAVDIRERGGKSTQADISIRGGSFDQTMVTLNGVDFSDARTGHQSHSLPVDADIISDISTASGFIRPGALAGAVGFEVSAPERDFLRVRLEGGAYGYAYQNISGGWCENFANGDKLSVLGAASYKRSDGYRHNTDFWNVNTYALIDYESRKAGYFEIQGGFQRRDWGSNGFYSLRFPDQFESTLTGLTSVKWRKSWKRFTLNATGSFRQNNDRFEMERGNPKNIPFNYHTTYNAFGELAADYDWRRAGRTSLGVNYTHHNIFSTALGESLDKPRHRVPRLDSLYPRGKARGTVSAFARHFVDLGIVDMNAAASVVHTPYGTDGTFYVDARLYIIRRFYLDGSIARSMRLPTFTELYYNVATYHPNPNLKPETAMTYKLDFVAFTDDFNYPALRQRVEAGVSVYYRDTRNVIDWEQRPDGDWWSTQLNRIGTAGVEVSARYSSKGWLRVASLNYGYIHSDMKVRAGYISKYALDYMRHKLSAMIGVGFPHGFSLALTGCLYDRVGSYIAADGSQRGYKPYFLLDGRFAWEPETKGRAGVQLYLDVANITDTRYFDFGGLPMPGCWASGGIVVTIK